MDLTILDIRWPLLFFPETDFIYKDLHILQKWTKIECGKFIKCQDFCPQDIESCHIVTARCVKLWLLNSNLFFKEPHQLTKIIHLIGPLKQYLAENISFQRSNCNILGLTDTVALSANEDRFFKLKVFSGHVPSKTKSVTLNFFCLFGNSISLPHCVASF